MGPRVISEKSRSRLVKYYEPLGQMIVMKGPFQGVGDVVGFINL